jgi:flagellar biogenesis protein FliO
MLETIRTLLGAMLLVPLLITTALTADEPAGPAAAANGAVSLRNGEERLGPDASSASEADDAPAAIDDDQAASGTPDDVPPTSTTDPENMALGLPNGPLSARPVESDARAETTLLDRLDPRGNEVLRVLGALAIVLALLFALRFVMRRAAGGLGAAGRPSGVLEILARYPIARGQSLMVLKMARRIVLVHHSGTTMRTLSEVNDPEEVAALLGRLEAGSRPREAQKFRSMLGAFERQHEQAAPDKRPREFRPITGGDDHVEIVDLTRRRPGGYANLLGKRRVS